MHADYPVMVSLAGLQDRSQVMPLCVGVRASLISYPVRFNGLLPGYPSLGGADWHVAPRGHAMLRSWPQGWVSGRRHMMTQESLLDALGAGGPDALVDGE